MFWKILIFTNTFQKRDRVVSGLFISFLKDLHEMEANTQIILFIWIFHAAPTKGFLIYRERDIENKILLISMKFSIEKYTHLNPPELPNIAVFCRLFQTEVTSISEVMDTW